MPVDASSANSMDFASSDQQQPLDDSHPELATLGLGDASPAGCVSRAYIFQNILRPAVANLSGPVSASPASLENCSPQANFSNFKYGNIMKIENFT